MRMPLILAGVAAVLLVLTIFWGRLDRLREWADNPSPPSDATEDERLFGDLLATGLVTVQPDGRLAVAPRDAALKELADAHFAGRRSPEHDPDWQRRCDLLQALYGSANGRAVRRQIRLWNDTRSFIAVRDDRPAEGADPSPVISHKPNQWQATDLLGHRLTPLRIPVPHGHWFVNQELRTGMSDWAVFNANSEIRLKTTLVPALTRPVTIQVIGLLTVTELPPGSTVAPRCPAEPCPANAAPAATIVTPALPPGGHDLALSLIPQHHPDLAVAGLMIARTGDAPPALTRRGWERTPPGETRILSADGVAVFDAGGPTVAALRLGLLPLIGHGLDDRRALAGILGHRPSADRHAPVTVALTIDSRIQAAARTALARQLATLFDPTADPNRRRRRAAVVVLDPAEGAVLAVAQHPPVPIGAHAWDIAASAHAPTGRDRLAPLGWQGLDRDHAPGSTFKPIVALAALQRAPQDPRVAAMIAGCRPTHGGDLPCLGLATDAHAYRLAPDGAPIRNFRVDHRHLTLGDALRPGKTLRHPLCTEEPPPPSDRFGLAVAVRDSVNVYFVRLADLLDGEAVRALDGAVRARRAGAAWPAPPQPRLVAAARRLGLLAPLDLVGAAAGRLGPAARVDFLRDILITEPVRGDLVAVAAQTGPGWRRIGAASALANFAIGQGAAAAPLHLARLAAAIATGAVPRPYLIARWDGHALPAVPAEPLGPVDLAPLRAGMKAVPEVGTAAGAFAAWNDTPLARARCRVFGKTGTGETIEAPPDHAAGAAPAITPGGRAETRRNTAWFMGWVEADPWPRPLAFACMVTHASGAHRTGGSVCAPIIRDLLAALAENRPVGPDP